MISSEYINADGFVTVDKNAPTIPGEGNGLLQTGLAYACDMVSTDAVFDIVKKCKHDNNPLVWRSPHKKNADDNQAADDYMGLFVIAQQIELHWLYDLYLFVSKRGWCFNIQNPNTYDLRYDFNRYPSFIATLKMAAGIRLTLPETIAMFIEIIWDSFLITHADENMKAFCRLTVAEKHNNLFKLAGMLWRYRIRRRYGIIGRSWAEYFGEGHPLNEYD